VLNNTDSPVDRIVSLSAYVIFIILFTVVAMYFNKKTFKGLFEHTVIYISLFSIAVTLIIFLQAVFPSLFYLNLLVSTLIKILIPLLFYLCGLGIIAYGVLAIIKKEIFVNFPPFIIRGPMAKVFGLIVILLGFWLILFDATLTSIVLCEKSNFFCTVFKYSNMLFGKLSNIFIILDKPYMWLSSILNPK